MWGTGAPATPPPHPWGLEGGGHQGAWLPGESGSTKGTWLGWGLVSGVAHLPWPVRSQGVGEGVGRVVTASSLGW